MIRTNFFVFAVALFSVAPFASAAGEAEVKAVALEVVKAVIAGDQATIKANFVEAGTDLDLANKMSDVITSANALHAASIAKFGDVAARAHVLDPKAMQTQVENSTVEVTGDTAMLTSPNADPKAHDGMQLKRVGGVWKVAHLTNRPATIMLKIMTPLATVMNETANEITAGKYPTSADAEAAMRVKMAAAMKAAGIVPTTRPAAHNPPPPPAVN